MNYFFFFHPYLGKWSNLTSIFFRWVGKHHQPIRCFSLVWSSRSSDSGLAKGFWKFLKHLSTEILWSLGWLLDSEFHHWSAHSNVISYTLESEELGWIGLPIDCVLGKSFAYGKRNLCVLNLIPTFPYMPCIFQIEQQQIETIRFSAPTKKLSKEKKPSPVDKKGQGSLNDSHLGEIKQCKWIFSHFEGFPLLPGTFFGLVIEKPLKEASFYLQISGTQVFRYRSTRWGHGN